MDFLRLKTRIYSIHHSPKRSLACRCKKYRTKFRNRDIAGLENQQRVSSGPALFARRCVSSVKG